MNSHKNKERRKEGRKEGGRERGRKNLNPYRVSLQFRLHYRHRFCVVIN
jgi:hypothetical protein